MIYKQFYLFLIKLDYWEYKNRNRLFIFKDSQELANKYSVISCAGCKTIIASFKAG